MCCGIGDSSLLTRMWHGAGLEPNVSRMHWDILLMRPTLYLDDTLVCRDGFIVYGQDPPPAGGWRRA